MVKLELCASTSARCKIGWVRPIIEASARVQFDAAAHHIGIDFIRVVHPLKRPKWMPAALFTCKKGDPSSWRGI